MSLLLRSAARVWTERPAGPILVALGILVAGLLAMSTDLALESAELAQEADDEARLGQVMARAWTPGGYTIDQAQLEDLQTRLAQARGGLEPARHAPLFLEREALVTSQGATSAGWHVLGLPEASLQALGLPVPGDGAALVDPADRPGPGQDLTLRVQAAPDEEVALRDSFQGQLARTVQVAGQYVHDEEDDYTFTVQVPEGAKRLALFLSTADNDTDMDLEATAPDGTTYLDDAGTAVQPQPPRIEVEDPAAGDWQVEVHAKLANQVAFRLEADKVFDARDAQALGRLLEGQGWRAVGAQLGLTQQARIPVTAQPADLSLLGPGPGGLVVMSLADLQAALSLPGRASGVLLMAAPGQDVLQGLGEEQASTLTSAVQAARSAAQGERFDPLQGLQLELTADQARQERLDRLESTQRLLLVVLPSGIVAGVLLSTWAAGLHTRRLQRELQVLAGLGQPRRASWGLVLLHLGPPFLAGLLLAYALSPLLGLAIARGIGLAATPTLTPGPGALLVPLAAASPVAAVATLTLRHAVEGQDPRAARRPTEATRTRWLVASLWALATFGLLAALLALDLDPTRAYLVAGLTAGTGALAVLWAPLLEGLLARARAVTVSALGLFRTRSSHAYLGLAAATTALVLAALLSGIALSQAATPDAEIESGGYPVISETPSFTDALVDLLPEGQDPQAASQLLGQTQGTEFLMKVTGTGIHSAGTGGLQTVYGIDTSFAQRHHHLVTPLSGQADPVRAVATSDDLALVSASVHQALDGDQVAIEGPQGRLTYQVVGVLETRLLEGVYVSKEALPTHFTQLAGEQRIQLPDDIEAEAYASQLQEAFKDQGLTARSSQAMVEDRLQGQLRAGTTLQALASLGLATLLLLVLLLGLRAQAERRSTDAVFVALGAKRHQIALGIATETLMPLVLGVLLGAGLLLPAAAALDGIEGLAFPLTPIDAGGLVATTGLVLLGLLVLGGLVSALVGYRAVAGLDQQALRELG